MAVSTPAWQSSSGLSQLQSLRLTPSIILVAASSRPCLSLSRTWSQDGANQHVRPQSGPFGVEKSLPFRPCLACGCQSLLQDDIDYLPPMDCPWAVSAAFGKTIDLADISAKTFLYTRCLLWPTPETLACVHEMMLAFLHAINNLSGLSTRSECTVLL